MQKKTKQKYTFFLLQKLVNYNLEEKNFISNRAIEPNRVFFRFFFDTKSSKKINKIQVVIAPHRCCLSSFICPTTPPRVES